ncbi:MAG TPA: DUF5916 domain-containing protein [Vicinamibacteria bacterium]|nr:DUF5916 domain-containing protein [Vicinamibacteria bacterium]
MTRSSAAFVLVAGLAASAAAEDRPKFEPVRATVAPAIDGRIDDIVWQAATPLPDTDWLTYNPLNGDHIQQRTEVRVAYDDRYLYFAFRCLDPEPAKVRGTLSRRDNVWNDDWVGLSLDSVGNGQQSYDLFVNPLGVQGDILNTPSAGENSAPDFVWDSGGRRTEEGYETEIRVPLTTVRFVSGTDVNMNVLFWRRVSRLGMSVAWPEVPAGASFMQRQATMVLHDLKRPLTLEVIPSATYSSQQTRESERSFGPATSDPDFGGSVKYGITSSSTVEGTINPDFSQVESDAFQVSVNQRFPLFFSEKRPFFMEGLGTFELAGVGGDAVMRTAVHTRRIVDPFWGFKSTGSQGKVGFALLASGDDAPGRQLDDGFVNPFLGDRKEFYIARGQYSLGPSSYVGAIATDSEFGVGHNRVGGADFAVKTGNHRFAGNVLTTRTEDPTGAESKDGMGANVYYEYATKPFVFIQQVEHYDTGFQMDTAFQNQVGITQGWTYAGYALYPDAKKTPWLKRINPFVFLRYGNDRIQEGKPWLALGGVRFNTLRQGFFRLDVMRGEDAWVGQTFPTSQVRVFAEAQLLRWLYFNSRAQFGRGVFYDPVNPYSGDERSYYAELGLQPTPRFNQSVTYDRVEFDRHSTGERVYTVNVLNTKTTFQLDRRLSLRLLVQWDSSASVILTDLLASWELLPGTVAYAGYGSLIERQQWDGLDVQRQTGSYATSQRGFFFKASYVHRF